MNLYKLNTPLQFYDRVGDLNFYIKRDDKTFAGFGTKIRKANGLIRYIKENQINRVLLIGNPHSNFMATFSTILSSYNFFVVTITFSRDRKLVTPNSILTNRFSNEVIPCNSKEEIETNKKNILEKYRDILELPSWGTHFSCGSGIFSLWEELEKSNLEYSNIFLDVGSGMTLVSALEYYKDKNVKIIGFALGNKKDKLLEEIKDLFEKTFFRKLNSELDKLELLEPLIAKGYSNTNNKLEQFIQKIYSEKEIPLDYVYSGKSLFSILEYTYVMNWKGNGIYVHQGGLLNHCRILKGLCKKPRLLLSTSLREQ